MKKLWMFMLILTTVTLSGCRSNNSTPATDSVSPIIPSLTIALSPTKPVTPTDTPSSIPSATLPSILKQTSPPAPTVTPSPTLTPPPTLEPEQAVQTIMILMQEPTAPCFWGVCPGQTTLKEAKSIFTHLGLDIEHTATRDGKEYYYVVLLDLEKGLEINSLLTVQDNVIKSFEINIHPEEEQSNVPREWMAYSPETLILHYGTPSKVEFWVGGGPRPQYSMVVYYDAIDLIIQYFSFKDSYNRTTNSFHLCPLTDQYLNVNIWSGKDPRYPPLPGISLADATSMTLDEFSELMMGEHDSACIKIPYDVMFP